MKVAQHIQRRTISVFIGVEEDVGAVIFVIACIGSVKYRPFQHR